MKELVVNIWIYIDLMTEMAYNWSGRVYCIVGTDNEKLEILNKLSLTDFTACERKVFSENIRTIHHNIELKGNLPSNMVRTFFENHSNLFFDDLEKSLPPIMDLNITALKSIPQRIPDKPLYVLTQIFEDEDGNLHPIITKEDLQWLNEERFKRDTGLF